MISRRRVIALPAVICSLSLVVPALALAQVDEDTGERDNFVLAPDGTMLVVNSPSDDNAGLLRRSGGVDSVIVAPGAMLGGTTIHGIGSNPHMNASGVAAFQIEFANAPTNTAIYTGTPGSILEIARTGDTIDGQDTCSIEPFPQINAVNQVFFGTSLEDPGCGEDEGRKGIFRFTPPSIIELMLLADTGGTTGNTILVSDTDFVAAPTTFDIVDAHLISFGGDVAGSNGAVMVKATLRPDGDASGCFQNGSAPCVRALLYLGPTPGTIQLIALEGASSIFNGQKIKGVANNAGKALFKAQQDNEEGTDGGASVETWTSGGGIVTLADTGDPIPGGAAGDLGGFTPHVDLNDSGNGAFTAGLDIDDESCDGTDFAGNFGQSENNCRGVYFGASNGTVTEIARTTQAAAAAAGAGASSSDGFAFEEIGSVAVIDECNTVYFVANNNDDTVACGPPTTGETGFGGGSSNTTGEATGIFAWNNGTLVPVVREGDLLADGRVMRLFTAMPELRQNAANNRFAIRAWLDDDDDCVSDVEVTLLATNTFPQCVMAVATATPTNTLIPGVPTNTPTATPTRTPTQVPAPGDDALYEIPTLGPSGLWLLVGLLALAGAFYVWRRGA